MFDSSIYLLNRISMTLAIINLSNKQNEVICGIDEILSTEDKKEIRNCAREIDIAVDILINLINNLKDKTREERKKVSEISDKFKNEQIEIASPDWKLLTNAYVRYALLHRIDNHIHDTFTEAADHFKEVHKGHKYFSSLIRKLLSIQDFEELGK